MTQHTDTTSDCCTTSETPTTEPSTTETRTSTSEPTTTESTELPLSVWRQEPMDDDACCPGPTDYPSTTTSDPEPQPRELPATSGPTHYTGRAWTLAAGIADDVRCEDN